MSRFTVNGLYELIASFLMFFIGPNDYQPIKATRIGIYSFVLLLAVFNQACETGSESSESGRPNGPGIVTTIPIKDTSATSLDMQVLDIHIADMRVSDMHVADMRVSDINPVEIPKVDMQLQDMLVQDMWVDPAEDSDNDSILNGFDNCIYDYNEEQDDSDQDGVGDICDNCPFDVNTEQTDSDQNGVGDACIWSGEGVEIVLTHSGRRLQNDVFLEITPPYVERFSSEVCNEDTTSSNCVLEDSFDTAQKVEYSPMTEGSFLISVKLTTRLRQTDKIKIKISCGNEVWLRTLNREIDDSDSIWDVAQIAWPRCTIRSINETNEINCNYRDQCRCDGCVSSICAPNTCSEQVSCNRYTGVCAEDCGGQICNQRESCDQLALTCESPLCQDCSILASDCPEGYICKPNLNTNGYCLKACDEQSDCLEGELCETQNIGLFQSAKLCTSNPMPCE